MFIKLLNTEMNFQQLIALLIITAALYYVGIYVNLMADSYRVKIYKDVSIDKIIVLEKKDSRLFAKLVTNAIKTIEEIKTNLKRNNNGEGIG